MNTPNYFTSFNRCYIIAEIGVNHNGDIKLAHQMIDAAKSSGADGVKFQTFSANTLASKDTPKVEYQKKSSDIQESHYQMLRRLELKQADHFLLSNYCDEAGLDFLSTPYDIESARFLNDKLNIKMFKTASADIVDISLQRYIASTGKPSIVSVGMASLGEIENVCKIYDQELNDNVILLHCVSNYPCTDESLNLNVLTTLKQSFQLPIGYSDHSIGPEAAILSLSFGAKVIEKHFTLDKNLPGPDHIASSTPEEFKAFVGAIRRAEKMLGNPIKNCQPEELQMAKISRKSLFLKKGLIKGEKLTLDHLISKRPGNGLSPVMSNVLIGKRAIRELSKGIQITFFDFSNE